MATHFDIRGIEIDSKTYARNCHVRSGTGDVSFDIPLRAGSGSNTDAEFYEVYRRISPGVVKGSLGSERQCSSLDRELRNRRKGRFCMLMFDYDSKDIVPTTEMVEHLSDIQYHHTDVIVTPSWFSLITGNDSTNVDLYIQLTDEYLSAANRMNSKPIAVCIPQSIPPDRVGDVIERYIGKDVTSFCIDSHSRALLKGGWMRKFQTSLYQAREQYGIENESLLLSINAYQGPVKKNEDLIEAWDFLGFSIGTDVVCGKHTKAYFQRHDPGDEAHEESTFARLFQPDSYCYEKKSCDRDQKAAIVNRSESLQIAEMSTIRDSIREGELESLLGTKNLSEGTLKTIYSMKDQGRGTTLDNFI